MKIQLEKIFKACGFIGVNEKLANDLDKIIDWQQKLKEIDISNVKPMFTTIGDNEIYISNNDESEQLNDDIFQNAPETDDNFFLVPKVIKK